MSARKIAALRAMADQDESPAEAEIARVKLRDFQARDAADSEWQAAWASQQEHERIADALERERYEAKVAELVRRWEHGTFTGMRLGMSATGPRIVTP